MMGFKLSELFRRIENIIREGKIIESDYNQMLFRVDIGENTTGWLRCLTLRAGNNKNWQPPEVGESVLVLSPSGDYANGFIIPALFTGNTPPPVTDPDLHHWSFDDGAVIEYNRATHHLRAILPAGATTHLSSDGGITLDGDITINGDITLNGQMNSSGDVVANGISLINHTHPGDSGGITGVPQ